MEFKLQQTELKQLDEQGRFEAIVATIGAVDRDFDIIASGAVAPGAAVPIQPGHDWRAAPLGKARIEERDGKLIAIGKLNLETSAGRDWYAALKFDLENPPARQEWSIGFIPLEAENQKIDGQTVRILKKIDLVEVSTVIRGAQPGTATVAVKAAVPIHHTEVKGGAWDAAANVRRLPSPMPRAVANAVFAFIRGDGDEVKKSDGVFPHHFVDSEGKPGAASLVALRAGIAILNGARGGANLTEEERRRVYAHLAAHLKDAGEEVPELRSDEDIEAKGPSSTFADQVRLAIWDVEAVCQRLAEVLDMHATKGRGPSAVSREELKKLKETCADLVERLNAALVDPNAAVERALIESLLAEARRAGLDV